MAQPITIEMVESLANEIEATEAGARAKLERLIRAHARIVYAREPERFERQPLKYADVDGHWDSSFPPAKRYKAYRGPRLIEVISETTSDNATSSGFYYSWERVTESPGLYVDRLGVIYGAEQTGTGRVGQFAAHPGDCDVDISIEYAPRSADEVTIANLREVESHMRALAFPASQAVAS